MTRILSRSTVLLCVALLLASCASPVKKDDWPARLSGPVYLKASEYLNKASQTAGQPQLNWQLLAGRAYAQNGQWQQLQVLLAGIKGKLTSAAGLASYRLLAAELALHQQQYDKADSLLAHNVPPLFLSQKLRLQLHLAERIGDSRQQLMLLARLAAATHDQVQQARAADRIWALLNQVDTSTLPAAQWQSWLALRDLAQSKRGPSLKEALSQWQQQYAGSLPARFLPRTVTKLTEVKDYQPSKVALLVPLTGPYAAQGKALRDGLIAAWLDSGQQAQLIVKDSASNAVDAWQQAQAEGADMLVGPLLKPNVQTLQQSDAVKVPWLALNRAYRPGFGDDYFFALAPEDEAMQAAEEAQNKEAQQPMILGLDDSVSQRQAQAFIDRWRQYGHEEPVPMRLFANRKQLEAGIRDMLRVEDSKARISQLQNILGEPVVAEARSRRDVDFIYLLGNRQAVSLMKAFIDVTISPFADPIAAYTTSRGHPNLHNPTGLRDFNGLHFSEMPFFVSQQGPALAMRQLLTQVRPHWPATLERFFALGYDAARLLPRMATLRVTGAAPVQGITGRISIDDNGVVHRRLQWVTIHRNRLEVQDHVIPPVPEQDSQGPAL